MKVASSVDTIQRQDDGLVQSPIKVSVHVLRDARTDYRLRRSVTALADAGYQVSVVDIETDRLLPSEENLQGVRLQHVIIPDWWISRDSEPLFFVRAIQAFVGSIRRLIQDNADIYHANDFSALPATCIAALVRHKPLIFEIYDLQFPAPETGIGFWHRLGKLIVLVHKLVLPRCVGVIVTSPFHAQEIRRHFNRKDMTLVRNVPIFHAVQKNNLLREYLALPPSTRIALYQGNLQPDRNLEVLIRAAKYLEKDIVIVMKGKSIRSTQVDLEALIAQEGVSDRVKIMAPVPYDEALDWTASADIGLIVHSPERSLNNKTLLPNKFFEFLMAGLPVIASSLDAIAEVITTYDVGHVLSSLAPQDVAEAINAMLNDGDVLERMRENALKVAREEFHWEKERKQLLALYEKIISRRISR
jgi:glycosyltransferase involved in cell wall biosynthesis